MTSKDNLDTWITSTMTAIIFSKEKSTTRNTAAFRHSLTQTHFSDFHRTLPYPITHKYITINFDYLLPVVKWVDECIFFGKNFAR